jgi:hypothetical protein
MQTTGLPSSHPVSPRNTNDNSASETARAAAKFSEAMHRALTGADTRSSQQKILNSSLAEETASKNKSDSDEISEGEDKKRTRAKRNSEQTPVSIASQFLGLAGAPAATPQPVPQNAGNAHDANEAKGSATPISDDSAKPKTIEAASADDDETVDQSTEAAPSNGTPAAETQKISAEGPGHVPAATAAAAQALAAQSTEPNSDPANPTAAAVVGESSPPNTQVSGSKTFIAQAGAPPPDAGGTSAAKQDITMKKVEKTPKVAEQMEQDLPGMPSACSEELPKGQKLSTKEAAHGSEKLESAVVEMPLRVLTSSDSPLPTVTAAVPTPSPALDTRVLERTHDIVALHAMRLSEYGSDSLHVVVKPGAGIQLSLELRQSARGIEVHASLHKGDFDQLSQHWPDLQQRLEARGVRMGSLTTSENFSSTSNQQFQQSKQQSPNQDPLYAGAFAEFALAGSMTEEPAARAARATAYRGWETWA